MTGRVATPYPWQALESVSRVGARRAARARRQLQAVLDARRIADTLTTLIQAEVSVIVRRVSGEQPRRRPLTEVGFEIGASSLVCSLHLEPELATNLITRLLGRTISLSTQRDLEDPLMGALNALVLEVARRSAAQGPLHVLPPSEARARANDVFIEATVLIAGSAYPVLVALGLPALESEVAPSLGALGELSISLPIVVGWSLAERAALTDLVPGNAWFPGDGLWLEPSLEGPIVLAAGCHDWGIAAALSRDGKIVLRGGRVQLSPDAGELMTDPEKPETSLTDAVLDSPVVVRVEVGALSLTARQWAELGPGDVIETGRRLAEPVVLRVAGREVARGELVNLEGELGVRIRELVRS